ncbi:MAG: hypothetical protein AAGI68_14700 [Planctomycetota bacterium]
MHGTLSRLAVLVLVLSGLAGCDEAAVPEADPVAATQPGGADYPAGWVRANADRARLTLTVHRPDDAGVIWSAVAISPQLYRGGFAGLRLDGDPLGYDLQVCRSSMEQLIDRLRGVGYFDRAEHRYTPQGEEASVDPFDPSDEPRLIVGLTAGDGRGASRFRADFPLDHTTRRMVTGMKRDVGRMPRLMGAEVFDAFVLHFWPGEADYLRIDDPDEARVVHQAIGKAKRRLLSMAVPFHHRTVTHRFAGDELIVEFPAPHMTRGGVFRVRLDAKAERITAVTIWR